MSIAFEQVSYTYIDPKSRKRKKRKLEAGEGSAERGKWGTDPDAIWALKDVSFSISDGEFFGICGHTGSGKSTLIQHMNGLVHPTEGRVLFKGRDLADKRNASDARTQCGLVFQYPEHQLFAPTVYEDVAFGPSNLGLAGDELDERVRTSLELVGLCFDDIADKSPFELSSGQQRRVAFAGVLAMKPQALVMDEPIAGLDPKSRRDFLALIKGLHESGLTVVMVSHSMEDLAELCDRVLVLNEGRVHAVGTPEDIFQNTADLKELGLAAPVAQTLAGRLREKGFDLPRVLYDTSSLAADIAKNLAGKGEPGVTTPNYGEGKRTEATESSETPR